jgi:hypothetical protein
MRRCFLAVLGLWLAVGALRADAQGIESMTTIWLLNTEARTIGMVGNDVEISRRMALPFALLNLKEIPAANPVGSLFDMHRKFYAHVREITATFEQFRKLATGRLFGDLDRQFPGNFLVIPLCGPSVWAAKKAAAVFDREYRSSFMKLHGISSVEDADFAKKIDRINAGLPDNERRVLTQYLDNMAALYPREKSAQSLLALVKTGLRRDLSKKVADSVSVILQAGVASGTMMVGGPDDMDLLNTTDISGGGDPVATDGSASPASGTADPAAGGETPAGPPEDDPFKILN